MTWFILRCSIFLAILVCSFGSESSGRFLYVAQPGIRNYLEYGGHGILIYDIDHGHRFVKRIPTGGLDQNGKPLNVKGICTSVSLNRVYVTTIKTLMAVDLLTEKLLWEKSYEGGCDRMAISPDGKTIYLPSLESDHWHVVDAENGGVIRKVVTNSGAHNTIYGPNGKEAYLAGLKSPYLFITSTSDHSIARKIGPFSASIRPFTVNGSQTRCYVNVNELLGFEIGDLRSGEKLASVVVEGFKPGPTKRHGCPSHGVALTPDEKELWLTDAANSRMHVFDNTVMPPKQVASIELRDQPGWITFTLKGDFAYPSTCDVIDPKTRKILTVLKDEEGKPIQSEKMVEIHFRDGKPVRAGDQFGIGQKR